MLRLLLAFFLVGCAGSTLDL